VSGTVPAAPEFFRTPEDLSRWFAANADAPELWVGFWKKGFERPGITYGDAVDEALCNGWIDSVVRRVDEASYMLRFRRRPTSGGWPSSAMQVGCAQAEKRPHVRPSRRTSPRSDEPPYTRPSMATTVRVPGPLRRLTGGNAEVSVDGDTVGAVLTNLDATYPGFHDRLYDDSGSLRQFINIYVNDSDIRFAQGLDTPIAERDEVSIVPAVAGGGGRI
jgi:molybdopterin synthase sulfur carrier subunit